MLLKREQEKKTMKKMKNIISVLLIVVMLLSAFSIFPTAQATDNSFKYGDVNEDSSINSYDAFTVLKYSLQGTTQGRYLTGGVPPVRFSM